MVCQNCRLSHPHEEACVKSYRFHLWTEIEKLIEAQGFRASPRLRQVRHLKAPLRGVGGGGGLMGSGPKILFY